MKTPQQKKLNDYSHARVKPHFKRRQCPRSKRFGTRQLRHAAAQLLRTQAEETVLLPERRGHLLYGPGLPLRERIGRAFSRRIAREGHRCFRKGYNADSHARFRRVLESWMDGRSGFSVALARYYSEVLEGKDYSWYLAPRRDFLARFFAREPELESRFKDWIRNLLISS